MEQKMGQLLKEKNAITHNLTQIEKEKDEILVSTFLNRAHTSFKYVITRYENIVYILAAIINDRHQGLPILLP